MAQLNISKQEYERLRRLGLSEQQIVQKYSSGPGASSIATKIANKTGFKGVVDTLGTNLANAGVAAKGLANVPGALLGNQASKDRFNAAVATSRELPQTTMAQNIGAGAQLGSLIAGGISGAGVPLALRTAAGAALGAGSLGGQAAAQGEDLGTVKDKALVGGAFGAGLTAAAAGVESLGKAVFKHFIPKNKQEAQLLQTYKANNSFLQRIKNAALGTDKAPRLTADTAFDKVGVGTESMLGVQAKRAQSNLWNSLIKPQLESVKQPQKMAEFFDDVRNQINQIPENTRRKALLDALQSVTDDYLDTPAVSMTKLQDIKSALSAPVPEKAYMGTYIQGSVNQVRKMLSDSMRKRIYSTLGDQLGTAYIDYNNLKNLTKLGQSAMTGAKLKGGFGGFWSGALEMVMVPIATIGGKTVYKVGNAVELVGRPGLNTVGQFLLDSMTESSQQSSQESTWSPISPGMSTSQDNSISK